MARQRVARTRAGESWTEARYWSFIRGLLRQGFNKYPVKFKVKNANRRRDGRRFEYPCALCNDWFPDKEVQVDHIRPCGSLKSYDDLPSFVSTLYCESDNLQVVCTTCHQAKTNDERRRRKKK
jgi:5-methylcytosine-specific restriction endonuclease McrA